MEEALGTVEDELDTERMEEPTAGVAGRGEKE